MRLPVTLSLRYSRRLAVALSVAHLAAGGGLVATALPLAVKLALWAVLGVSLAKALRPARAVGLALRTDGVLELVDSAGQVMECRVHPASTVFPWLVLLLVEAGGRTTAMALPVDALGPDGHRQLRLWLKWKASAA